MRKYLVAIALCVALAGCADQGSGYTHAQNTNKVRAIVEHIQSQLDAMQAKCG